MLVCRLVCVSVQAGGVSVQAGGVSVQASVC